MKTFRFLLLLTVALAGCYPGNRPDRRLNPIDRSQVVEGALWKNADTTRVPLSEGELDALCRLVNTTGNAEMYKTFGEYHVELVLKDTTRLFKYNGRLFGERDLYIGLRDTSWIPWIYEKGIRASGAH